MSDLSVMILCGRTPRHQRARDSDTELTMRSGLGRACSAKNRVSERSTRSGRRGESAANTSGGTAVMLEYVVSPKSTA